MATLFMVLDEYEQRDGYFGYDIAFDNREEAEKAATLLKKLNKGGCHDVFEVSSNASLHDFISEMYGEDKLKELIKEGEINEK